jgi:CelD/BcsL family acetyltransferase involved in cellulose biosynthesis
MPEIEIVTAPGRLAAVAGPWWELWRQSRGATVFQSPGWLIPWWQVFAPGALATIAVWEAGRLIALAPLYLEDGPYGRRLLPLGIGISDHLDLLLMPDNPDAARALGQGAARLPLVWDSLELEEMPPDASALGVPPPPGLTEVRAPQSACPAVVMDGEVDISGLPMAIPGRRRQFFRRAARRVDGARAEEPVTAAFLETLESLHAARWAARDEPGVLADPRVSAFHRLALPGLRRAGLARLTVARVGGRPAAALYQLCWGDRLATYVGGFDPQFAAASPLNFLVGEAIIHAARQGRRRLDFLRGQESYKYHWGATDVWNCRRSFRRLQ